jgi:hypothetical protein
MIVEKDAMFVLCCLWDRRAYLRLFLSDDPAWVFNINYVPVDVRASIIKLLDQNYIEWSIDDELRGSSNNFLNNLHDDDFVRKIVIGLTEYGGGVWENHLQVKWRGYMSDLSLDSECYYVNISNFECLNVVMKWIKKNRVKDKFDIRLVKSSNLTYWKRIECFKIQFFEKDKNNCHCDAKDGLQNP